MSSQVYEILEIVDRLGIERKAVTADNFYAKCPFCGHKRYVLNCNIKRNIYRCNYCGTNGGAVDFFTRVTRGVPYDKSMRDEIIPAIRQLLGSLDTENKIHPFKPAVPLFSADSEYSELTDDQLDELHQRLLDLPDLELLPLDREQLMKRGLPEESIIRNQYRSFRTAKVYDLVPVSWKKRYEDENWDVLKRDDPILSKMSKQQILSYLWIGGKLTVRDSETTLEGLPGAFRFCALSGEYWGIRLYDGILIPIRNRFGKIVAMQVRSIKGQGSKYLLLSSCGMAGGRKGKTRIHHPLEDLEGGRREAVTAVITEGPLKSDVYAALDRDIPYHVMAVVGVQTTSNLPGELSDLGIHEVYEAFDMDKVLKPQVLSAVKKLKAQCHDAGIDCLDLFWDLEAAMEVAEKVLKFASLYGVKVPGEQYPTPYHLLGALTTELHSRGIKMPEELTEWPERSKGIDDYCRHMKRL